MNQESVPRLSLLLYISQHNNRSNLSRLPLSFLNLHIPGYPSFISISISNTFTATNIFTSFFQPQTKLNMTGPRKTAEEKRAQHAEYVRRWRGKQHTMIHRFQKTKG